MKRLIALAFAVGIAGATVIAQQTMKPETAAATKSGWWVRVGTINTEAVSVTFQIGTKSDDRKAWRSWRDGDAAEFDVPADFRSVKELYLQASANPDGKNMRFCVFFQKMATKNFNFSGGQESQMKQSDRDDSDSCK